MLAIFDVDGTLVDSQKGIVEAQRRAFAALGMAAPSRERSLSIVGLSLQEAFRTLVGDDEPVAALAEAYKTAWSDMRLSGAYEEPLFEGAHAGLLALRELGCRLGIATGKSRRGVEHLIARYGWHDIFDTVQTADDAPSKPAPDMILQALRETSIAAADTVMIGDTTFDMLMARAAHVEPIGVAWGYHRPDALTNAGASILVEDFAALIVEVERRCRRCGPAGSGKLSPAGLRG